MTENKPPDTARGLPMFQYRELAEDGSTTGRTISFAANVQPLGYAELVRAKLNEKVTIPLRWENSTLIDTNIEDLDKGKSYSANAKLESEFTSRAIGLVKGGWL